jgi:hypothetical protein
LLLNELERLKAAHEEELAHLREELAAANDEHARELAELRNALVSLGERVERLAAGR